MTKTYAQLAREIQALQAHAEKLRQSETKDVIARLNESIAQYGLTAQDLHFPGASASSSSSRSALPGTSSRATASSNGAKYSDGPGRVWGGRGPRPAWLREAMAQGRSLESFAATGKASRGGTGGIAPAKVSLPPLYAHPKTGQTWSGRGPKPAWLKQSLKKRGTSIEDFLISAQGSTPESASTDATSTPASAQAAPAPRKVDGKKTGKGTAKTGTNGQASAKSLAEKVAARTQAAPAPATKTTAAAPAKKGTATKSVGANTAPTSSKVLKTQKSASKANGASSLNAPDAQSANSTPTPETAAVKKTTSQTSAKSATNTKGSRSAKPAAKKAAPAKKNLPASMAPSSEPAPTPPAAPAAPAALQSGSESSVDESRKTDSNS
jgi:DNA-binding protein H-NS